MAGEMKSLVEIRQLERSIRSIEARSNIVKIVLLCLGIGFSALSRVSTTEYPLADIYFLLALVLAIVVLLYNNVRIETMRMEIRLLERFRKGEHASIGFRRDNNE